MRILWLSIFLFLMNVSFSMDIVKTWKVAVQPKPLWHRKMDQAIKVQLHTHPAHHYLHNAAHPCCKY
jgi:hypothetical protein